METEFLRGTDWNLLRAQKAELIDVIAEFRAAKNDQRVDYLSGILHWIDSIQDEAAEVLGDSRVFGDHSNDED